MKTCNHFLRVLALLLALCLLFAGCSKEGSSVGSSQPASGSGSNASSEQGPTASEPAAPTNPDVSRQNLGEAADAVARFLAAPRVQYTFTSDLDYKLYYCQNTSLSGTGELVRSPLAVHATSEQNIRNCYGAEKTERTSTAENWISVFGDGSEDSLFSYIVYHSDTAENTKSVQLCLEPEERRGRLYNGYPCVNYASTYSSSNNSAFYLTDLAQFLVCAGTEYRNAGTEELDGRPAVRYEGRLPEEAMFWFLLHAYAPMDPLGTSEESIPILLWVDSDSGLPLRARLDATELERRIGGTSGFLETMLYKYASRAEVTESLDDLLRRAREHPEDIVKVDKVCYTVDLRYEQTAVVSPVPLPDESEREVYRLVTDQTLQPFAQAKLVDRYTVLTDNDAKQKQYLLTNSWISSMEQQGLEAGVFHVNEGDSIGYFLRRIGPDTYTLSEVEAEEVCRYGAAEQKIGECVRSSRFMQLRLDEAEPAGLSAAVEAAFDKNSSAQELRVQVDGTEYVLRKLDKMTYEVCRIQQIAYTGEAPGAGFEEALTAAMEAGETGFDWNGTRWESEANADGTVRTVYRFLREGEPEVCTKLAANLVQPMSTDPAELRRLALEAAAAGETSFRASYTRFTVLEQHQEEGIVHYVCDADGWSIPLTKDEDGTERFEYDGKAYRLAEQGDTMLILDSNDTEVAPELRTYTLAPAEEGWHVLDAAGAEFAVLECWRVVRTNGEDRLPLTLKHDIIRAILEMQEAKEKSAVRTLQIPGNVDPTNQFVVGEVEAEIRREDTGEYTLRFPVSKTSWQIVLAHEPQD